jgi:hypothetical protein
MTVYVHTSLTLKHDVGKHNVGLRMLQGCFEAKEEKGWLAFYYHMHTQLIHK